MRLRVEDDLDVVGEAADGAEVLAIVRSAHPDVVLMDVEMPTDGITATAELAAAAPEVAVLVMSLYDDAATRSRALEAGAAAFVPKHLMDSLLLETIRRLSARG